MKTYIWAKQEDYIRETGIYPKYEQVGEMLNINAFEMDSILGACPVVSFGNPKLCFSFMQSRKGRVYLRMHQIDIESYLKDNARIEEEVRIALLEGKPSPLEKMNLFSFSTGAQVPAITYQVRLHPSGRWGNLGIYKSLVRLDKTYKEETKDTTYRQFVKMYHHLQDSPSQNPLDIEEDLEQMFLRKIQERMVFQYQPAIMVSFAKEDEERYAKSHYTKCELYSSLPKNEAHLLYGIFKESAQYHYTNDVTDTAAHLKSMTALDYITYLNQKFLFIEPEIKKAENGRETYGTPNEIEALSNQCVQDLNQKIGYTKLVELESLQKKYIKKQKS